MENYNPEFNNESAMNQPQGMGPEMGAEPGAQNGGRATTSVKEKATEMKDKLAERASTFGSQLGQKIDDNRTKASQGLRQTSQRMDRLAMYLEEHNSKDMGDALIHGAEDLIRRYPGRSIVVGIVAGLMLGRIFR